MQLGLKYTLKNEKTKIRYNEAESGGVWKEGEVPYISFPALAEIPFVHHGFSTRLGGVSQAHLSSMNLSYARGDKPENVDENYKRICQALGIETKNLVFSDQVHDTVVSHVTKKDTQGMELGKKKLEGIDGLITDTPNVVLCTSYADCVPLFFVDPKHRAIGLSHSGWRGTVGKIGARTVAAMKDAFGTKPEDIIAVIGPSICQACYEVSEEVAVKFEHLVSVASLSGVKNYEQVFPGMLQKKENNKYQLDLWLANQLILLEAGIPKKNISISGICTCCNAKLLYSHRASQGQRGNLAAFLSLGE